MWCAIELNLGIFGGCVTAIRPFIRQYFPRLLGLSSGGGYGSSQSRKQSHPLNSMPRSQRPDFSGRDSGYITTLSTSRAAPDNDSEEHILSAQHTNPNKELDGIMRTVEFDVENAASSMAR